MSARILICNDDGFDARGIHVLEEALAPLGEVIVVAPDVEQSASSHSLTIRRPIGIEEIDARHYRVSGTPTDCVVLATQVILERAPDLLVSGINHGPNMGEDVTYSGTVAAAFEGTILGIPSIAISALQRTVTDEANARFARAVVEQALERGLPPDALLNVNIPDPGVSTIRGLRVTRLGSRAYENFIEPPGRRPLERFYTIGGESPVWKEDDGTDIAAVRTGHVSITPLHLDLTHYDAMAEMERWGFDR